MAVYEFAREDGKHITRQFPIGTCPTEITDEDGTIAKRVYTSPSIHWKAGQESPYEKIRQREARGRDNIAAGERGRKDWEQKMPKLVEQ